MVKALTVLIAPFMPSSALRCARMLNLPVSPSGQLALPPIAWDEATVELPAGHALGEPVILFQKLDPGQIFADGK